MKKIYIFLCAALCCTALQAQLTGVKIYVNPGHGGFTGNDRNVATPGHPTSGHPFTTWNDETGFWESASNLDKGFYLRDRLLERNAIVKMSRTTNTEADDVSMQTLADDADSFGADVFISIHTNAGTATDNSSNYLYLMYRNPSETANPGEPPFPTTAVVNTSIDMAKKAYPYLLDNPLNSFTAYYPYNASNIKIGADNVNGVQRRMLMSGFLSEGSFHTYVPEACRLLNLDYKHLEALRMFRHFVDYYGAAKETTGTIAGYVKTKDAKLQTTFGALSFVYHGGSDDQWHPLNGATVKLLDASGMSTLKTYTVDNEWNGIFVFYNLAPGNYKLQASMAGYVSETVGVTVTAAKTANQKIFLKAEGPPKPDDPANYPDPEQDAGVVALSHYDFEQQGAVLNTPCLNANNIKRAIHRNGKLYVLTKGASPKIFIADPATLNPVKEMNLTGISGGQVTLSDIAFTADDKLLACNKQLIAAPETQGRTFKVYIWDNDDAVPALYFEIVHYAGANFSQGLVGETMAVSGPSWKSTMYLPVISRLTEGVGSWNVIRFVTIEKEKDAAPVDAFYGWADQGSIYKVGNWGEDFQIMISPRADDCFIVTSSTILPTELKLDKTFANNSNPGGDAAVIRKGMFAEKGGYNLFKTNGANYFRYAGKSYMAAPVAQAGRVSAGVVLFDITDGLNNAVKLSEQLPAAGLGTAAAPYMTAYGTVDNYDITLAVLAENQGFATFKTNLNPKPDPVFVNYPDPKQDAEVEALSHYDFEQQGVTLDAPWLNASNIKRAIHRNGKLYVLTKEASPKIFIADPATLSVIKPIDLTGVSGGQVTLSDIAFTADNKLLACNKQLIAQPETQGRTFKTYIWDNDDAVPAIYIEMADYTSGNFIQGLVGETMAVSGPSGKLTMYLPVISRNIEGTGSWNVIRFVTVEKVADAIPVAKYYGWADQGSIYKVGNWGEDFQIMISPRADDCFIVTSNSILPTELQLDKTFANNSNPGGDAAVIRKGVFAEKGGYNLFKTNGANYFRYAGKSYMAAPVAQAGRVSTGVVLFDITDGLNNAVKLSEQLPESGLGAAAAPYMTAYGTVDNYDITLAVLAEKQGFATFKTKLNPTGIIVPKQQEKILAYPNPTSGIVYTGTESAIKVYNAQGALLQSITGNQVDLSTYPQSIYLLQINGEWTKVVKK